MNDYLAFDIKHLICQEYYLSGRDLCQLALTSRSWRDAALPRIWAELGAITPLLKLLPEDAWYMKRQMPDVPKLYFVCARARPISSSSVLKQLQALRRPLTRADWEAVYDEAERNRDAYKIWKEDSKNRGEL